MKIQFFNISSHATLKEIFTAKYNGVLPRTAQVRPKSKIYTPKRDNEHPHPFHVELGRLYLTIIPGARMGSESIAHEAKG